MTYFSIFEIHNNGGSLNWISACIPICIQYIFSINKSRDKDGVFSKLSPTSTILSAVGRGFWLLALIQSAEREQH